MKKNFGLQPSPFKPVTAYRATQELIRNKEDTSLVFKLVRALGDPHMPKKVKKFAQSENGRKILSFERELVDVLSDREYLRSLPEGSLGRRYLEFVESEQITADGLVDASNEGYELEEEQKNWDREAVIYINRVRDAHDLWHVVSGYGRDPLGELALLAYSYSQIKTRGFALIVAMGAPKIKKEYPRKSPFYKAVRQGYTNGRKTKFLPFVVWEELLDKPLDEVRAQLGVRTASHYQKVREDVLSVKKQGDDSGCKHAEELCCAA